MYTNLHANKDYDIRTSIRNAQVSDIQEVPVAAGWTRIQHQRSILFRLKSGKRFPTIKVGLDEGIRVEVDTLEQGEIKSSAYKFVTIAEALPLIEQLFKEHTPNASTTTFQ